MNKLLILFFLLQLVIQSCDRDCSDTECGNESSLDSEYIFYKTEGQQIVFSDSNRLLYDTIVTYNYYKGYSIRRSPSYFGMSECECGAWGESIGLYNKDSLNMGRLSVGSYNELSFMDSDFTFITPCASLELRV